MTSRQLTHQAMSAAAANTHSLIQRRPLAVNTPGDRFEREADRAADAVMNSRGPAPFTLSTVPITHVQREDRPEEKTDEEKYKEAAGKIGEAFLETPLGRELAEKVKQDRLVKGAIEAGKSFIGTLPGKIITGAAAAGAVATLAAAHKELPAQIPEIPLDALTPGLSVAITYKGPVDKPTEAMITFKYSEQAPKSSGEKKSGTTEAEKFRAETARIAADQARFRAGLKYPPGSPEDLQQKAEDAAAKRALAKYAPGPDLDALARKYPWLGAQKPQGGPQLTPPMPTFGYKPPALLGDEYKLKLPGDQKKKDDEPVLQRQASNAAGIDAAPPVVHDVLQSPGQPLDAGPRAFMEARFGHDFSRVRIHTDARAAESARAVSAAAYTVGRDIVFATGQFTPGTQSGRRLLAHELTHVVQQGSATATGAEHSLMRKAAGPDTANALPAPDYKRIADQIHEAIWRIGTDEEAVYRALQELGQQQNAIDELQRVYLKLYKVSLLDDIYGDFSDTELEYALQLLNMGSAESKQRVEAEALKATDVTLAATRIRQAVEPMGTDEEAIFAVLLPFKRNTLSLANEYQRLYHEDLRDRLSDELSGSELDYALELLETPYEHYVHEGNAKLAGAPFGSFGDLSNYCLPEERDTSSGTKHIYWYDKDYWESDVDQVQHTCKVKLVTGKSAAAAIDAMFEHQDRWKIACAEFVQIVHLYALRHTLGAARFDERVSAGGFTLEVKRRESTGLEGAVKFHRTGPTEPMTRSDTGQPDPRPVDEILAAAPIGSRVRWSNLSGARPENPNPWEHENTIKLGPDKFGAHGTAAGVFSTNNTHTRAEVEMLTARGTYPKADTNYVKANVFISEIETFRNPA